MKFVTIYLIDWNSNNFKYIGRTNNINSRIASHINAVQANIHANATLQEQYNTYGMFNVSILETCLEEVCVDREAHWIREYLTKPGVSLINVTIRHIEEPSTTTKEYSGKFSLKADINTKSKYIFVSPYNTLIYADTLPAIVKNDPELSIIPSASNSLSKVWLGKVKQYKGYRKYLGEETYLLPEKSEYILYDEAGIRYIFKSIAEFCRGNELLKDSWYSSASRLSKVINGKEVSYKGFSLTKKAD